MRIIVLVLGILALTACASDDIVTGVSDSTFVRALSELRRVPTLAGDDSVRRVAMRDSILRRYRVTRSQLDKAARALAAAPSRAQPAWDAIEHRANQNALKYARPGGVPAPIPQPVTPRP